MTTPTMAPEGHDTTTVRGKSLQDVELSRWDRCDQCGAQAFMIARNPAGSILLFCGHHGAENLLGLIQQGFDVDDRRHLINQEPSPSSA